MLDRDLVTVFPVFCCTVLVSLCELQFQFPVRSRQEWSCCRRPQRVPCLSCCVFTDALLGCKKRLLIVAVPFLSALRGPLTSQGILCKSSRWLCGEIRTDRQFLNCSDRLHWHQQPHSNLVWTSAGRLSYVYSACINALSCCHAFDWTDICVNKQLNCCT